MLSHHIWPVLTHTGCQKRSRIHTVHINTIFMDTDTLSQLSASSRARLNTHTQTDIHLQVDTWLYPLTCNFRHRCAGRPHTHVRLHTDTDHKISDREHMCSHGICLMTLTLMCTPALHSIFKPHTNTLPLAPMQRTQPLANRFGWKASAKKINVNVIGNGGVIGLICPLLYKCRDSLFDMVIIKGQWECC